MEIFQTVIVVAVIIVVALIITGVVKAACRIRKGRASGSAQAGGHPAAASGSAEASGGLSQASQDQPPSYADACPASCIILVPSNDLLRLPPTYDSLSSTSRYVQPSGALYPLQADSTSSQQLLANSDRRQQPPAEGSSAAVTTDDPILLTRRPSTFIYVLSAATADELLPTYESLTVASSRPLYAWI